MACCGVKELARSAVELCWIWEVVAVVLERCWGMFMPLCCTDAFDGKWRRWRQ